MDEKRDAKALGLALATVPISIIGSLSGADLAQATETTPNSSTDKNADTAEGAAAVKAAGNSASAVSSATQLNYTVKAGDTISAIARKFQLSTKQLLQLNKLEAGTFIVPGQKLKLIANSVVPAAQAKANAATIHVVKRGETVASIAKLHSVSISTVLSMNNLSAKAIIFPGQRLTIGSVIPKKIAAITPDLHVVQPGETLASIANQYGIQLQLLLSANGLTESSLVYAGQSIKLKSLSQETKAAPTATPSRLGAFCSCTMGRSATGVTCAAGSRR